MMSNSSNNPTLDLNGPEANEAALSLRRDIASRYNEEIATLIDKTVKIIPATTDSTDALPSFISTQPGISLYQSDLRPELLINNIRSGLYPNIERHVHVNLANQLADIALSSVKRLERYHLNECPSITPQLRLVQVGLMNGQSYTTAATQQGQTTNTHNNTSAATATAAAAAAVTPPSTTSLVQMMKQTQPRPIDIVAAQVPIPPITKTEEFFSRLWSGELFGKSIRATSHASSVLTSTAITDTGASAGIQSTGLRSEFDQRTGKTTMISTGAARRCIAKERWIVQRCDTIQTYHVHYYSDGDFFEARVLPTSFSSFIDCLRLRFLEQSRF